MESITLGQIATAIGTITVIAGFAASIYKAVSIAKKDREMQSIAIKNLLKSQLVNQYYLFKDKGKVPMHVKATWNDMYESYVALGGNSFVKEDIKPKWDELESFE